MTGRRNSFKTFLTGILGLFLWRRRGLEHVFGQPQSLTPPTTEGLALGYEPKDANARGLMWFGISLVIAAVLMHLGIYFFFHVLNRQVHPAAGSQQAASQLLSRREPPPPPRLQVNPAVDFRDYYARETGTLNSYGWINRPAGVARIPIQRAMEILAHETPSPTR